MDRCRPAQALRTALCNLTSTSVVVLLASSAASEAQDQPHPDFRPIDESLSVAEIALELNTPFSRLPNVSWALEYRTYQGDLPGAGDQTALKNVFAVSWPFEMDNGRSLLLRAALPVLGDQPAWQREAGLEYTEFAIRQAPDIDPATGEFILGHNHMGDLAFGLSYGGVNENGVISSLGIANVAQTSEDGSGKRNQWLMGPEASLGQYTDWGLVGIRATHLTDIYGEPASLPGMKTNETTLEIYLTYAFGNGWQFESNPVILFDWEAVSGNKWSIPVSAGLSKTSMFGRFPVKIAVDLQHFVVSADRFGPEWLFRFSLTPFVSSERTW
jgi:hypothetical protein